MTEFMNWPENDPENNAELMRSAFEVMVAGHAMADFILNNEDNDKAFLAFCAFVECENDEDKARLRETMLATHDAFQMMASRAQAALMAQQFRSLLSMPEGDPA